jgi:hypothetical protein
MGAEDIINNEINGAENAIRKMLLYYISALHDYGIEDVKDYVAKHLSELIDFSEDQYSLIKENLSNDNKVMEGIQLSIELLKSIKENNSLDIESVDIVIKTLERIVQGYNDIK